jgi:uncharacterized protein
MPMDSRLLEILCCPSETEGKPCHGDLQATEQALLCQKCGLRYPIEDDIPVMLADRAVKAN